MYQKGDVVTVTARELKSREYNGKTYYNLDADSIVPDDLVLLRWMQQMIDMMAQPAPPPELEPTPVQTSLDRRPDVHRGSPLRLRAPAQAGSCPARRG